VQVPEEIEALREIDARIFKDFPGDLFDAEDWRQFESYWMVEDGAIVGCSAFLLNVDYDESPRSGSLYIVSTGVLPEARGRGLGRKQKEWQIDFARSQGFEVIVTNMRKSNRAILRLNEEVGFKFRSIHPSFYYEPEEDAIVMERRIVE
jgi:ribosomal protein S18 acetylase RimI-like enzyme